jgi:hypothetical protein
LLTLLKQARAYGLGLVLATQNPVDLDYKALSNAGSWFLGRLQTERDKLRVLDGLEGASTSSGAAFDRQKTEALLSGLGQRVFLLNNIHEEEPVVFQTRWCLSYLAGPLTKTQIQKLMQDRRPAATDVNASSINSVGAPSGETTLSGPPILPSEILQRYLPLAHPSTAADQIVYLPAILGRGRSHYVDSRSKVDLWRDVALLIRIDHDGLSPDPWESAQPVDFSTIGEESPVDGAHYDELPAECSRSAKYKSWSKAFKDFLYRNQSLTLSYCSELKQYSLPSDQPADFRARLAHLARETRDLEIEKLRRKYESAAARLKDRLRRAEQRVEVERQQATSATVSAALSFGTSLVGALFGRKRISSTNIGRAATSMRAAGRAVDQRSDVQRAEDNVSAIQEELDQLNRRLEEEADQLKETLSDGDLPIEEYEVRPRKADLAVEEVSLAWLPYRRLDTGKLEPAFPGNLLKSSD